MTDRPSHSAANALMIYGGCPSLRTLAAFHRLTPESRRENTIASFRKEIALQHYLAEMGVRGARERLHRIGDEFLDYGMREGCAAIERAGTYSMRRDL